MINQLGPIEMIGEAPPYAIVQACRMVGIQAPEDVGWWRMNGDLGMAAQPESGRKHQPWLSFFGLDVGGKTCACGGPLPEMFRANFILLSGQEKSYLLGQCNRCLTVYWEER